MLIIYFWVTTNLILQRIVCSRLCSRLWTIVCCWSLSSSFGDQRFSGGGQCSWVPASWISGVSFLSHPPATVMHCWLLEEQAVYYCVYSPPFFSRCCVAKKQTLDVCLLSFISPPNHTVYRGAVLQALCHSPIRSCFPPPLQAALVADHSAKRGRIMGRVVRSVQNLCHMEYS